MPERVEIEFKGSGDILQFLERMGDDVGRLGEVHKTTHAHIQSDLKKSGEETRKLSANISGASNLVVALAKSAGQGLPALARNLESVADITEEIQGALSATDRTNLTNVNTALRDMAAKGGVVVKELGNEKKARLEALVAAQKITAEEAKLVGEVQAVVDSLREASTIPPPDFEPAERSAVALRTRIRELREAAAEAKLAGDEISFVKATREASELQEAMNDTNATIQAFNPDHKLGAMHRFAQAAQSGAQAVSGFFFAFAGGNSAIQESLFQLQSVIFAFQGLDSFLADIGDTWDDVRRVLGLSTKAQEANTLATEADIVAKEADAVATTEVGVASTGAASKIKAFALSLVSTPLGIFLLGLAAVAGAMALLSDETERAKKTYADLLDEIQRSSTLSGLKADVEHARALKEIEEDRLVNLTRVRAGQLSQAEADAQDLEARRRAEKVFNDARRSALIQRQEDERKAAVAVQDAYNKLDARAKSSDKEREDALKFLGLEEEATAADIDKAYEEMYNNRVESAKQASAEVLSIDAQQFAAAASATQKSIDDAKSAAEVRIRIREELAAAILAIEKSLADQIAALEEEQADPNKQLELRRAAARRAVDDMELNLRRELALRTVAAARLADLSDAQKVELADRLIAEKNAGQLSVAQQEQLNTLRLLTERKFLQEAIELQAEQDQSIAELLGDLETRRLAELDKTLQERATLLRDAGVDEVRIAEDAAQQTLIAQADIAKAKLDLEQQTQLDLLGIKAAEAKGNVAAERAVQLEVLAVKIEFAERSLRLIEDNGTAESDALIAAARRTIAELKAERDTLESQVRPLDLFDLLGIQLSEASKARLKESMQELSQAFSDIIISAIEARQREIDSQIAATDAIINDERRRRQELESERDKEEERAEQGRANNLDGVKKNILETQRAENAALAEKKRLQGERARLARRQVLVEAASQAASLATSAANLISSWSALPFGVGLVAAFAQVAALIAFFTTTKAKLSAASAQAYYTGTKSVRRQAGQAQGIDTIPAMLTEDEAVIPVVNNQKHRGLVGAIIDDDFSNLSRGDLAPILAQISLDKLLEGTGVSVNEEAAREAITMYDREQAHAISVAGIEGRLDELNTQVRAMREADRNRTTTERMPDGSVVRRSNGYTEIIR